LRRRIQGVTAVDDPVFRQIEAADMPVTGNGFDRAARRIDRENS